MHPQSEIKISQPSSAPYCQRPRFACLCQTVTAIVGDEEVKCTVTLCLLLALVLAAGCSTLLGRQHALVGQWESTGAEGSDIHRWQSATKVSEIWFKSDGTFVIFVGPMREGRENGLTGRYQMDDQSLQLNLDGMPHGKQGLIQLEGDTLIIHDPNFDLRLIYRKKR